LPIINILADLCKPCNYYCGAFAFFLKISTVFVSCNQIVEMPPISPKKNITLLILVAALGYFVDIYDLLVFSIVRVESFKDIGIAEQDMRRYTEYVINMQMGGLLLGGILWGIMGDKLGRIKVLFGSILLYSIANTVNGFITDIHSYAIVRFIAGIGLAGELGAGITLVSETMDRNKRGYGTMIVAFVGLFGAVAAYMVHRYFNWRTAYITGGTLGFILLLLRIGTFESGLYKLTAQSNVARGDIKLLLRNRKRWTRYIHCIMIGVPLWFVVGILITQSPEIGKALGAVEPLNAGQAVMYSYIGISVGDLLAGLLAQVTKSRKFAVVVFLLLSVCTVMWYLNSYGLDNNQFRWIAFAMGIGVGYWATFVTIASEQFGTNIRATVTTTVPNFVRGSLIPITFLFEFLVHQLAIIPAAYITMFLLTGLALYSLSRLKESFNKDLDYIEED
jgi:putative MFS transporter